VDTIYLHALNHAVIDKQHTINISLSVWNIGLSQFQSLHWKQILFPQMSEKIHKYKRNSLQKECGEKEYSNKKTIQKRKGKMYTTKEQAHPQRHS